MSGAQGLSSLQRWLAVLVGFVVAIVALASMHSINRTRNVELLRAAFPHLAADDAALANAETWLSDSSRNRHVRVQRWLRKYAASPSNTLANRAESVNQAFSDYLRTQHVYTYDLTPAQRSEWFAWYQLSLMSPGMPAKDFRGLSLDWFDMVLCIGLAMATSAVVAGLFRTAVPSLHCVSQFCVSQFSVLRACACRPSVRAVCLAVVFSCAAAGVAWAILRALGSERDSTNFVAEIGAVSVLVLALGACFRFRPFSNFFTASPVRVESPTAPQ